MSDCQIIRGCSVIFLLFVIVHVYSIIVGVCRQRIPSLLSVFRSASGPLVCKQWSVKVVSSSSLLLFQCLQSCAGPSVGLLGFILDMSDCNMSIEALLVVMKEMLVQDHSVECPVYDIQAFLQHSYFSYLKGLSYLITPGLATLIVNHLCIDYLMYIDRNDAPGSIYMPTSKLEKSSESKVEVKSKLLSSIPAPITEKPVVSEWNVCLNLIEYSNYVNSFWTCAFSCYRKRRQLKRRAYSSCLVKNLRGD